MSAIGGITPAAGTRTTSVSTTASSTDAVSLLPEPTAGTLAGADPLSMLYLWESKDQQLGVDEGTKRIGALQTERHQALQQEEQTIQQAVQAENQHSFWDTLGSIFGEVAKVAAVVASVAAAAATLGAATPIAAVAIAGAVLSTASFADGELHVLQSLGVDEKTAGWIDMGMSIGGAALSVGAGIAAGGRAASSALSIVGKGGTVVAGASQIGKAACGIEGGEAQARSDQAAADQVAALAKSDRAARWIRALIADAQSSAQQSERITETIVNTKAMQNEMSLYAARAVRG